jgi:hypothetical protein|tara:strand:+ start:343 stop:564 length:222 start_codon:yes stop_codon:yes gene_type:complete
MSKKKLIREFQEEFVLSDKYEYSFSKDLCGRTIELIVPKTHARRIRLKLPRRWRGYRTIVNYRNERIVSDDDE